MLHNLNLEIYEFKINNYPTNLNMVPPFDIKTHSLADSEYTECEMINTIPINYPAPITKLDDKIRSCDPIKGEMIINNNQTENLLYNTTIPFNIYGIKSEDLIKFSNKYGAKNRKFHYTNTGNSSYSENRFKNQIIKPNFRSMEILYDIDFFNDIIKEMMDIVNKDWAEDKSATFTLIKKIIPTKEDKFLIIGDIHGSYHTFIRILLRLVKMEIMDSNCLLINNYNLIFLGDVVDRGQYSYEILMLLFLLKVKNREKIYLNRGNHEEELYNKMPVNGFLDEMMFKFSPTIGEYMHKEINNILQYLHSALLIKNPINGKFTYLAHGGFPTDNNGKVLDNQELKDFFQDDLKIFYILNNDEIRYNNSHSNSIRWNDFKGIEASDYFPLRGAMRIGKTDINKIQSTYNIELIIRGHQDLRFNTKIIKEGTTDLFNINDYQPYGTTGLPSPFPDINCYKFTHLITINEATGHLLINSQDDNILPVITLSTNTDYNRNLSKDSFAILKYNKDNDDTIDKCVIAGSLEEQSLKAIRQTRLPPPSYNSSLSGSLPDSFPLAGSLPNSLEGELWGNHLNSGTLSDDYLYQKKYLKYKQKYLNLKKLNN